MRIAGPGAKSKTPAGYVLVYYPNHPDATKKNGKRYSILEHRLVMEGIIGRRLMRREQVHHINGIKDDNRPENLKLMDISEHTRETTKVAKGKRVAMRTELEEYRRRYGPLSQN